MLVHVCISSITWSQILTIPSLQDGFNLIRTHCPDFSMKKSTNFFQNENMCNRIIVALVNHSLLASTSNTMWLLRVDSDRG